MKTQTIVLKTTFGQASMHTLAEQAKFGLRWFRETKHLADGVPSFDYKMTLHWDRCRCRELIVSNTPDIVPFCSWCADLWDDVEFWDREGDGNSDN